MRFLYLDFDKDLVFIPIDPDELERRIDMIARMTHTQLELRAIYPTARGCHVLIVAQWSREIDPSVDLTPPEIVCLQLLLGSDPRREAFNLMRAHTLGDAPEFWRDRWNVLYSEKIKG